MLSRPLSPDELSAIRTYLEQHPVTRCPSTGRGEELPHLKPTGWRLAEQLAHAQRLLPKSHTSAPAGSESRRNAA